MKKYLILLILISFIIPNTFYTNNNYTGIVTKKGKASFGLNFSISNIESYFNQNTIDGFNEYELANGEIEDLRRSEVFKSFNMEYITKFGLEVGLSGGTVNSDNEPIKHLSLGYHFKGKNDKTNGFITVRTSEFSYEEAAIDSIGNQYFEDKKETMEGISLGIYSGKGFWFKIEHLILEENGIINQEYDSESLNFISFGQAWNKKGFIIGLSYTMPLNENTTDNFENNNELENIIMQGDISFNIGFAI